MVRALISWSLHNRFIVLLGDGRADCSGHPLGAKPERRGVSRPDAAPGRGDHPESRGQPRGDGAADLHPDRDGPERDARAEVPAEHLAGGAQRHQVPVRVRDRLLDGPAGGDQPDRHGQQPARRASTRVCRPGARPARSSATCWRGRIHPQPAQGGAGLGARTAASDRARRDRRDRLRRDGQAISGPARHPVDETVRRDLADGHRRDLAVQRQRRRRRPAPGTAVAQCPGHRLPGRGARLARPGRGRPRLCDRGREARRHPGRRRDHATTTCRSTSSRSPRS